MRKYLFVGCVFIFLLSQAPAEEGKTRCCMPGKNVEIVYGSSVVVNGSYYRQLVHGAYDFAGRRYGSISNVTYINGTRITVRIMLLPKEGAQYYIFNGTCVNLRDAFVEPKRCISDDYRQVDFVFVGDGDLSANVWGMRVNDSKHGMYGDTYLSATVDKCVPVGQSSLVYLGVPPNLVPTSDSGGYHNFTKTIFDPDFWFTPPSFCPPANARVKRSSDIPLEHIFLSRLAMIGGWSPF